MDFKGLVDKTTFNEEKEEPGAFFVEKEAFNGSQEYVITSRGRAGNSLPSFAQERPRFLDQSESSNSFYGGIVDHPEQRLSEPLLLTEPECHQLLVNWNATATAYPKKQLIPQLFGLCVERSLDMVVGLLGILKAGGGICAA